MKTLLVGMKEEDFELRLFFFEDFQELGDEVGVAVVGCHHEITYVLEIVTETRHFDLHKSNHGKMHLITKRNSQKNTPHNKIHLNLITKCITTNNIS